MGSCSFGVGRSGYSSCWHLWFRPLRGRNSRSGKIVVQIADSKQIIHALLFVLRAFCCNDSTYLLRFNNICLTATLDGSALCLCNQLRSAVRHVPSLGCYGSRNIQDHHTMEEHSQVWSGLRSDERSTVPLALF